MGAHDHLSGQQFFHITDNPKFALDPHHEPENNTTIGGTMKPGIFLDKSPESWVNGHNYVRPYVAEIHASSDLDTEAAGYHGERFVPGEHFDKLQVKRVIPLDAHARETYGSHGWIEEGLGTTFDTNEKITPAKTFGSSWQDHHPFGDFDKGSTYRYGGPDVRDMPKKETDRHARRATKFLKQRLKEQGQ